MEPVGKEDKEIQISKLAKGKPIDYELNSLREAHNVLGDTIDKLFDIISPAMTPEPSLPEAEKYATLADESPSSEIAERLRAEVRYSYKLSSKVRDMLERIEL